MTDAGRLARVSARLEDTARRRFADAARLFGSLEPIVPAAAALAAQLRETILAGGTVLTCGNGGSAAEAMHLAEELVGCYRDRTRPARAAVCLNADPTALTCIANDLGYDEVFARGVDALGRAGDLLVVLSTSGNSPNVVRALERARERGVVTAGLLGKGGGDAAALCEHPVVVPHDDAGHVQEVHLALVHVLCEAVESHET